MSMTGQEDMKRATAERPQGPAAPPRLLLWLVVGLFLLAIIGGFAGIYVFRNVLRPGQQQRIIGIVPFMSAFVARTDPHATIPTAISPGSGGISPEDLLSGPLVSTTAEPATETDATAEPLAASLLPTATALPTLTFTPQPSPTPTDQPTLAPTQQPGALALARYRSVPVAQVPASQDAEPGQQSLVQETAAMSMPRDHRLFGITHVQQTWNNCGPANITMALSYFSWHEDQEFAAGFLKPDSEDKNVNPTEMVAFVNGQTGVRAVTRMGGDMALLKQFVAADFPVIIETGYAPEGYDWIGHYRTVVGYDDNLQQFHIFDSYLGTGENGAGLTVPYNEFDADWQAFNRLFIVIYLPEREREVISILGERTDVARSAELALQVAQSEARANPRDKFAWFNMGTSLAKLGRYEEAAAAFDQASQIGLHFRMLWYQFGPYEAYYNVGRYDDVLALVNINLNNGGNYVEETYYWQGMVYAAQGRNDLARQSFTQALRRNPRFTAAQTALDEMTA